MIVGTAGHIDHGKTALVRALTGVDTDRLPEEKRRGISIELGYAYMPVPGHDEPIGFIDVPGHERLVHTMVSGATGIDHALLLVAADDGPMPQTREHLAVLSLLGLSRGAVVITKCDRVDADRRAAVQAEVQALLAGSSLQDAPMHRVSALTGEGLPALRAMLFEAARSWPRRVAEGAAFRLAVDRAFTLDGVGTVVTGCVQAGCVAVGDELQLVPGDARARVRSLHVQGRGDAQARAGQRAAVALAGVSKEAVSRGQWLVAPRVALETTRLDAHLTLWPGERQALRSGTPVHVHLGAAHGLGTVVLLTSGEHLEPGASALVQLVLRQPQGAWCGDRLVLRDASASRTIAGGVVLDPFAPARYRRTPQRLAELVALQRSDPAARAASLLQQAGLGVNLEQLARATGRMSIDAVAGSLSGRDAQGHWALDPARAQALRSQVLASLSAWHDRHPEDPGPEAARLRRLVVPRLSTALWHALLDRMLEDGDLVRHGAFVQRPEHAVHLSATEGRLSQKVAPLMAEGRFEGAWVRDLALRAQEPEALVRATLARLARRGELHQVVKDLYYTEATMAALARLVRDIAARQGGVVTAAGFRDATQLGRKRAIQILEYFDRIGLLHRAADVHRLRADCGLFTDEPR